MLVHKLNSYKLHGRGFIPSRGRYFCLCPQYQTSPGVHTVSCATGTRRSFFGVKCIKGKMAAHLQIGLFHNRGSQTFKIWGYIHPFQIMRPIY
jgi:hypothetical protein